MAAECNITGLVLEKLNELQWGFKSCEDTSNAIAEHYLAYLDCPDIMLSNCYPAPPCENKITEVICSTTITKITRTVDGVSLIFTVLPTDMLGFQEPVTYQWTYDSSVFIAAGPVNDYQLQLTAKPGLDITTLVAKVGVKITDKNECFGSKDCYTSPTGMQCADTYNPCSNPINLQIVDIFVECAKPSGLITINI